MKNKTSLILNLICTLIYALFTLMLVLHHEIWADEAQVWQLCRHLSIFGLFKHLVNEGHPSFFYLLIMPAAKILHGTAAIMFMQIVCWLSMVAAVFLFLQYSPFSKAAKFAVVTSCGFLYFFPVIARSYSILPLLVFSLAILYPKSDKHPYWYASLLFVTANTHIIMLAFCGLLTIDFLYKYLIKKWQTLDVSQKKTFIGAVCVMFFGLLAVVLQLHGTTSSNVVIKLDFANLSASAVKVISQFFINAVDNQWPEFNRIMFPMLSIPVILVSMAIYAVLLLILLVKDKKLFSVAFLSVGFQILIYIFGYNNWIFVTRIFCAHIILIFCFWLLLQKDDVSKRLKLTVNTLLTVFFIFTFFNGIKYALMDLRYNYSSAKETTEFIQKNIDSSNSILITDNDPHVMGIVYYLDGKRDIYSVAHRYNIKYVVWDKQLFYILSRYGWQEYTRLEIQKNPNFENKKIYAVIPFFDILKMGVTDVEGYKLIYESSPAIIRYEGFRIYEYINPLENSSNN